MTSIGKAKIDFSGQESSLIVAAGFGADPEVVEESAFELPLNQASVGNIQTAIAAWLSAQADRTIEVGHVVVTQVPNTPHHYTYDLSRCENRDHCRAVAVFTHKGDVGNKLFVGFPYNQWQYQDLLNSVYTVAQNAGICGAQTPSSAKPHERVQTLVERIVCQSPECLRSLRALEAELKKA